MAGVRWGWIAPGIVQVPVPSGSIFLLLDDAVTVVDAGLAGSAHHVLAALARVGRSPRDVSQIVVTHRHTDHSAGVGGLLRHMPAAVLIHAADAPALNGLPRPDPIPTHARRRSHSGRLRPSDGRWPLTVVEASLRRGADLVTHLRPVPPVAVQPIHDGHRLSALGGVQIVHTPGHTPGHSAVYLAERGVLIAGDALQRRRGNLTTPARIFTEDWSEAMRSIQRMSELSFHTLAFSHFPPLRHRADEHVRQLADRVCGQS